ncbi:NUDIX domain-containing protein [Actinocorallia longicatena]|uniref:NUDIX domain-containing protein n=1 Tax=Actinocorallia longicatena TaxID=111803 RepID=UPI0031E22B83
MAVLLVPVDGGLLTVRRGISPGLGELALPGGFIDVGETWQEAAVRELREESGVVLDAGGVRLFDVHSAPDGTVLVFGAVDEVASKDLPEFAPTDETTERVVIDGPRDLAFPLQTLAARNFFARPQGPT